MRGKEYEIAFKIAARLESQFNKSFQSVNHEVKQVQDQLRYMDERGNSLMQTFKRVGTVIGGAFAAHKIFGFVKDAVNTFAEFENEMQRVRALSGATNEEFEKLVAQAKELNATTVFTGQQAAEGMAFLAMAGYETNDILAAMPGLLSAAAAGQEELGVTADIVSNVLQGFGIAAEETGRVADVLTKAFTSSNVTMGMIGETMKYVAPNAKAAGISLEETAAAAGLLGNAGIQASMAGTSLRSVISRMSAPTGGAAKLMKELGISAVNADGSLKSLADIVEQVTEATEDMAEAQTIETVKTLVGERATAAFLSLMDAGADTLRKFTGELQNSEGAAKHIADTMLNSFTGSMTLLNSAIESAKISLGEQLAPTIREVADWIAKELPGAVDRFIERLPQLIQMLKTAGVALAGIKIGKGALDAAAYIRGLSNMTNATNTFAGAARTARGGVGFLGSAMGMFTNPVGLAITAVSALGAGIYAWNEHQKQARKELLNMGESMKKAYSEYHEVVTHTEKVSDLIAEYDDLNRVIKDAKTPTEELEAARARLKEIEEELIRLNPDILKAEDAKSGRFREQLGLVERINENQRQMAQRELEKSFYDSQAKLPQLEEEYQKLTENLQKFDEAYNKARESYDQYLDYVNRFTAIRDDRSLSDEERSAQRSALAREIEEATGKYYGNNWATLLFDMQNFKSEFDSMYDKWVQTNEEIQAADQSFKQIYDTAKEYIELNLGGDIEEMAKEYDNLSAEQKAAFDEALQKIAELNAELDLLPDVHKIDVQLVFDKSRGIAGVPDYIRHQYNLPSFQQYADGGFSNKPAIFGEAGLEAAIPIDNRPRSHALLDKVNQMMGHKNDNMQITFAPHISISSGSGNVKSEVEQATEHAFNKFKLLMDRYVKEQRRVSF